MPPRAHANAAMSRAAEFADAPASVEPLADLPRSAWPTLVMPGAARPASSRRSRWSGDGWLLVRGGGSGGAAFGVGQLGGSQAGLRLAYAIDRRHRIAIAGRLTSPLHGAGAEAAIGIEWRPMAMLPVRLIAEERLPLDGGRAAPAIGAVGGIGPTPIAAGFRLEAYGQAGMIDRGRPHGFADGAARAARPLATIGGFRLDGGGGVWGGAQQGAARLDIGPTIGVALPAGTLPMRLTLDWRQRVAGQARPGSGVALSLGADF